MNTKVWTDEGRKRLALLTSTCLQHSNNAKRLQRTLFGVILMCMGISGWDFGIGWRWQGIVFFLMGSWLHYQRCVAVKRQKKWLLCCHHGQRALVEERERALEHHTKLYKLLEEIANK